MLVIVRLAVAVQPAAVVTVTVYVPATEVVKVAALPGLLAPAGTVHA